MAERLFFKTPDGVKVLASTDVEGDLKTAQAKGWTPIDQAQANKLAEAGSLKGQARTFMESAATGAFDALTAVARVPAAASMAINEAGVGAAEKAGLVPQGTLSTVQQSNENVLKQTSGRQLMSNAFGIIDELRGEQTAEAGALQNAEQQRTDQAVNPGTAFTGTASGQVLAALPFAGLSGAAQGSIAKGLGGGIGARLGSRALLGAVEGAPIAAIASQDQAFLEDRKLTAQQMMADVGLGSLLAGTVSFGLGAAEEAIGAGKRTLTARLTGKAATPEEAAALEAGAESMVIEASPKKMNASSLMKGLVKADDRAIVNVAGNELGTAISPSLPKVLRQAVREGVGAARDEMIAESVGKLAAPMRELLPAQEAIQELVDTAPLKQAQVASKFARDGIGVEAIEAARGVASSLRQSVDDLAMDATAGRAAQNGAYRGLQTTLRRLEGTVATAETADAAYMAIDQMRRDTYGVVRSLNAGVARSQDPAMIHAANSLIPELNKQYLGAANFLMDEGTWGSMGAAQRAIITARVDLIKATQDGLGTVVDRLQSKDLDLATGRLSERFDVNEGKIASLVKNFGTPNGAVAERRFGQYHAALRNFAESAGKHLELEGEQAAALTALRKGATELGKTFDEVSTNAAAHNQVASLFERAGHGNAAKLGGIVGGFVAGGPGAAIGAGIGALSNPSELLIQRVKLEGAAQAARAKAGALLDGVFAPVRAAARGVAAEVPRTAARLEFQSPRAAFQGNHETAQDAYVARVTELQDAARNFAQAARDGTNKSFGPMATAEPHVASATVVTATNAINFLNSKIPVDPLFDPESMTPTASKLRPSPVQLGEFARYWHAVYEPMSVLHNLKTGSVSPEEIEALKAVYPSFYEWVRTETIGRLRKLDEEGITVPPRQRQTLDALLDLKGAGDRTLRADFAIKYAPRMGDASRPQNPPARPRPSSRPVRSSLKTETDAMLGGGLQ